MGFRTPLYIFSTPASSCEIRQKGYAAGLALVMSVLRRTRNALRLRRALRGMVRGSEAEPGLRFYSSLPTEYDYMRE